MMSATAKQWNEIRRLIFVATYIFVYVMTFRTSISLSIWVRFGNVVDDVQINLDKTKKKNKHIFTIMKMTSTHSEVSDNTYEANRSFG